MGRDMENFAAMRKPPTLLMFYSFEENNLIKKNIFLIKKNTWVSRPLNDLSVTFYLLIYLKYIQLVNTALNFCYMM